MYIFCCIQGLEVGDQQILAIQSQILLDYGAAQGTLIKSGEVYRLITASFLHANLMHIIMNSISLLFIATRF